MAGDLKVRCAFDSVFGFKLVDQRDLDNTSCPFYVHNFSEFWHFHLFFLEVVLSGVLYY